MAGVYRVNWLIGSCASKSSQVGVSADQSHVLEGDKPAKIRWRHDAA
eukprot:gene14797-biopygen16899